MATKKTENKTAFDFKSITGFEEACAKENIDPEKLPEVSMIPEKYRTPLLAAYKLMVGFDAVNDVDVPDYSDLSTLKYEPRFWVLSSGAGFDTSLCTNSSTNAGLGSRFATLKREKLSHMQEQFEQEFKDLILLPKQE